MEQTPCFPWASLLPRWARPFLRSTIAILFFFPFFRSCALSLTILSAKKPKPRISFILFSRTCSIYVCLVQTNVLQATKCVFMGAKILASKNCPCSSLFPKMSSISWPTELNYVPWLPEHRFRKKIACRIQNDPIRNCTEGTFLKHWSFECDKFQLKRVEYYGKV